MVPRRITTVRSLLYLSYASSTVRPFTGQHGRHHNRPVNSTQGLVQRPIPFCSAPTHFKSTMSTQASNPGQGASDWSPDQYLLFRKARNRAIHDLITFLGPDYSPKHIIDLGCGPGNSTEILATRFPTATTITGVDSSPSMLTAARKTLPNHTFTQANLLTYTPPSAPSSPPPNLLFSNAVFHWLRTADRIPTITRLLLTLPPGGILAFQVPDNHAEPSHVAMRETAAAPGVWREFFARLETSELGDRPDLDPIESSLEYYDALKPYCREVEIWGTRYEHVLGGAGEIVEWVRGTGLMPFLNALPEGEVREAFLGAYQRRLEGLYPKARDGSVLLGYPRRFVVAVR